MKWNIINNENDYPEEGKEVVCAITKHGMKTVDPSYTKVTVDENGKEWRRLGYQIEYQLLWRNSDKWENWDIDDYENNPDYMRVIAWADRLDFELAKEVS